MIGHNDWIRTKALIATNTATNIVFAASDINHATWGNLPINGAKYCIMNDLGTLDQNGEYYHNYTTGALTIYWNSMTLPTVEVPSVDSIINLQACDYITIENLNLIGSRVMGIKIRGGSNITIQDCETQYAAYAGIYATGATDVLVRRNYSHDNNNNIYFNDVTDGTISENMCKRAGIEGSLDDDDLQNGVGIFANEYNGITLIEKNMVDSSGSCGIEVKDYTSRSSPGFTVQNNLVRWWGMMRTDCGGIYTVSNDDNVTKDIVNNFLWSAWPTTNWALGLNQTMGIYLDNVSKYTNVENNTVYDAPANLFINYSGEYNQINNNTFVRPSLYDNHYARAGMYTEGQGSVDYLTFTNNLVVLSSSETPAIKWNGSDNSGAGWTWDCADCILDNNKYASAFSSLIFTHMESWENTVTMNLASWRTGTGQEYNSEFKGSTVLSQYYYVFGNWSANVKIFNLGSTAVLQDYDGTIYSGTLTLAPYTTKVLFYISGSTSGMSENLYTEMSYTFDDEPPPVLPVTLKIYRNTVEQSSWRNGNKQLRMLQ